MQIPTVFCVRCAKRLIAAASFVAALAGAGVTTPASAIAEELGKLTIRVDFLPGGHQSGFFLAVQKGWYKKAGLDVIIEDGTGSATGVQLAAADQVDVAYAALSVMAFAHDKGLPVTSIGVMFRKSDAGIIVPKSKNILSLRDFKGKTVAFSAGGFEAPFIDAFFAAGGLTRNDINLLSIDATAKTATMIDGKMDGVFGSPPVQLPLVNPRQPSEAFLFYDIGLKLPGYGMVTSMNTLRKKASALKAFASISAGAWDYVRMPGHEAEAIDAVVSQRPQARLNATFLQEQLRLARDYVYIETSEKTTSGFQTDAEWEDTIAILEKANTIKSGSKPKDYYTNAYLDQAVIAAVASGQW